MTTLSMSEIIAKAQGLESREQKVSYLRNNNSKEFRNLLLLMYDNRFELDLPDIAPPYRPSDFSESHGLLYRECRKLSYFIKGHKDGENLTRVRKEQLFIQMLESVDKSDSELLIRMIEKRPFDDLPADLLVEALGFAIQDPVVVKRGRGRPVGYRKVKES